MGLNCSDLSLSRLYVVLFGMSNSLLTGLKHSHISRKIAFIISVANLTSYDRFEFLLFSFEPR